MAGENVFVVTADPENFDTTVASPVALDEYDDVPDELSDVERVRIWGVHGEDGAELFDEMATGDLVLFYHEGRYVGVGTVGTAFSDETGWVSETLWEAPGSEFVYTVEGFQAVDLSRAAVHAIFGYSANYYPSAPMQVPTDRVTSSSDAIYEAVTRYDQGN